MANHVEWQRGEINIGYSIIGITLGAGALLIPWMIKRFGPKNTLAAGAIMAALASIFMALFGRFSLHLFGHAYPVTYWGICLFLGLGTSLGSVIPVQTLVLQWFNLHRALAMGLVMGGGAIGGFIYPQIISACIVAFGGDWQVGWYVVAIACFAGAVIALFAVRNSPGDLGQYPDGLTPAETQNKLKGATTRRARIYRTQSDWEFRDAIGTSTLWLFVVVMIVVFFLWQTIVTQTPAHLQDRGFSPADPLLIMQPAFIYGLILACSIIGRLSISVLGERIEPRFIIAIAATSLTIGGVLFWFASKDNLWATYLYPLFTGFGFGATYVSQPILFGNYFGLRPFTELSRITHPIASVFQYMAPAFAGFIYDANGNYGVAVMVACTAGILGTVLVLFCTPPKAKKSAPV